LTGNTIRKWTLQSINLITKLVLVKGERTPFVDLDPEYTQKISKNLFHRFLGGLIRFEAYSAN